LNKQLSIIIPVYNSEKYLNQCINSCIDQNISYDDYEIIIVNDGSSDHSAIIINDFKDKFNNIKYLHRSNMGAGASRNIGLEFALGKYVWFIDSDDWIEPNCLRNILDVLEKDELDALQISFNQVKNDIKTPCLEKYLITTSVLDPISYIEKNLFLGSSWSTIFLRSLTVNHHIRFKDKLVLAEDQLFLLETFYFSSRIKRISTCIYNYRRHSKSIVSNLSEENLLQSISIIAHFEYRKFFQRYCDFLIQSQLLMAFELPNTKVFQLIKFIKKNDIRIRSSLFIGRDKTLLRLYSIFGPIFLLTYSFVKKTFREI
jgi:glycosyltransferase involved in cell wall biosynthesis